MGALALAVGLPAAYLLVCEKPGIVVRAEPTPWGRICRTPVFWLLITAVLLVNIPGAGILGQLQPILIDGGLARGQAAAMLSIYAGAVFAGRLGFGFLLDRIEPTWAAAFAFAAPSVGAMLLIDGNVTAGEAGLVAALLGLSAGAELDIMGFFVARFFGLRHYSALFGTMITALVIANASGNILYGRAFDATGSYSSALMLSIGGYLVGALAMILVGRIAPAPLEGDSP